MLYSNERKLILSGWLKVHNNQAYCKSLRLQKFLFLYEAFTKAIGNHADFVHLRGYMRGPVFSAVWGDYTKERSSFDSAAVERYSSNQNLVDDNIAQKASFIVSSLTEGELSDLTHKFNIWNAKSQRILSGEQQVELSEQDFGDYDIRLVQALDNMFPASLISNSEIISIEDKYFVFDKADAIFLTEQHYDILSALAEDDSLHNPVFVSLDEEGRLIVD